MTAIAAPSANSFAQQGFKDNNSISVSLSHTESRSSFSFQVSHSERGGESSGVRISQEKIYGLLEQRVAVNTVDMDAVYRKIAGSDSFSVPSTTGIGNEREVSNQNAAADRAVNNILGFIDNQLALDKANGATEEQLQQRLEAGLKGFKQGFGEAQGILKDMGLLDIGLDADIGQTYERVHQGLVELEQQYSPNLEEKMTAAMYPGSETKDTGSDQGRDADKIALINEPQMLQSLADKSSISVPRTSSSGSGSFASVERYEFKQEQRFEFELTTADGDKVKILASSLEQYAAQAENAAAGDGHYSSLSFQSDRASGFDLAIEGDLSGDELEAINHLLAQVVDLAGDFYSGDIGTAFNKATQLGYDSSQIADFSVNLSQTTQAKAVAAYEGVGSASPWEKPAIGSDFNNLGGFVKDLLDSIEAVKQLGQPNNLVTDLLGAQVEELEQSDPSTQNTQSAYLQDLLRSLDV